MTEKLKVLVVEDDILIADTLEEILTRKGFEVCGVAANERDGLALALQHRPSLAVIDVRLAGGDLGTVLAVKLMEQAPLGILYATGNIDFLEGGAAALGDGCIKKPYSMKDICTSLLIIDELRRTGFSALDRPQNLMLFKR